jgi:hypothetical protein
LLNVLLQLANKFGLSNKKEVKHVLFILEPRGKSIKYAGMKLCSYFLFTAA